MTTDDTADGEPNGDRSRIDDGDVSTLEEELRARGEPYARATVVRREPPVSSNVGDRAVVTADGELHGWVGGAACAQSIVATQGREAIEADAPRLVGIAPDPETVDRPGLDAFPMTCHSDGVLEIFLEPVTPTTELVVVGDSPVAGSLTRLADELALDVTRVVADAADAGDVPDGTDVVDTVDPDGIAAAVGPSPLVVVASMGKYDARGIAAGVAADAPYVGLIASDARAEEEVARAADLLDSDPESVRAAVTNPAGVNIEARTPAELAAGLLAEVVDVRAGVSGGAAVGSAADGAETTDDETADSDADAAADDGDDAGGSEPAVDPVCGMTVDPDDAAASVEHGGRTYHFCCHGCADSFESEPSAYVEEVNA
ncbi:XdhC family protein [Halostella litorea]|uniref:XdhC family protein n=1 Tax=Halostella litorea TaxID=2528831 RepID=UPI00109246BB|nr:XdhC family protein [Halostella litorea]